MFIHFAFGTLGKRGKIEEQTEAIIQYILKEKRLKASKCKEFIPAFPMLGAKRIPWTQSTVELYSGIMATSGAQ